MFVLYLCYLLRVPQKHKVETGTIWAALSMYHLSIVNFFFFYLGIVISLLKCAVSLMCFL
jgi:hypothetical protein